MERSNRDFEIAKSGSEASWFLFFGGFLILLALVKGLSLRIMVAFRDYYVFFFS